MFVHLHCHSHYSFLRAVPTPEELIAAAVGHKMPAVALTDTNGLYAPLSFYKAARKAGVKAILGAMADVEASGEERGIPRSAPDDRQDEATAPLLLLAANIEGYSNLCRVITERQLSERAVSLETLHAHREGLIALAAVRTFAATKGPKGAAPKDRSSAATDATEHIAQLEDIFGDALYLEVQRLSPGDRRTLREAERIGRALGIPLAATNNVHFVRREEHLHHRVLNAIRTGALLTTVEPPDITTAEAYFKSAEEMQRTFPDHEEALRATLEIAERCNVELKLGETIFPEFPVPKGETPFSYLSKLCFEGARRRYGPSHAKAEARLTHELDVIGKRQLAPYFLLVWDIVEEARRRGIPTVARGSAASSIVTYCLGISRVCPLRWELYFERFLTSERSDFPDIDIDICGARRDELLEYVYKRWGAERVAPGDPLGSRVAMIGSFVTMHARMAVREVAKVFGLSPAEVNHFTHRLPHGPVSKILEAIRALPECRSLPANEEPWKTILDVAQRLDDFPRNTGIHPCGTVIAAKPLTNLVPLEIATKGIVVTQYDMNAVEAFGLIKMDLLGQRGFTTMTLALDGIARATGKRPDFNAIPEDDPATCTMVARGHTMGIFQIESPGMRGLLRALEARTLDDICLALALIRPGAADYGSKETLLKRARGEEQPHFAHPALEGILGGTFGVCVYQEQVMQISHTIGNLSLAEADIVRRATARFSGEREHEHLHEKFLKAAVQMGVPASKLDETWKMVEKFVGFGFCKAHAATYADISYRMAYLKAHWPAEFLAAMCSSGAGFYHVSAYVEEAKRWGIEVRLPSVNHSRLEYTTEMNATEKNRQDAGATAMRIGLMQVRGLRTETIDAIVRAREEKGAFHTLEDFLARVAVERDEIEALIKCGAFDGMSEETRPALLWRLNLMRAAAPVSSDELLFPNAQLPGPLAEPNAAFSAALAADYTRQQRLMYEREILEVCVSGHPLDGVARNGEVWSDVLEGAAGKKAGPAPNLVGRRVALLGWVVTWRHVGTKDYRNMMFVTMEDQRGLFEAVLFPEAYERYGGIVYESRLLRATGRVERSGQINCEKLEPLRRR